MEKEIEKKYKELKEKHGLPDFDDIDREFQASSVENKNLLLKEITKKINEKIELFSGMLEEILSPERFSSLHESTMFSDQEKKDALKVYRRLHYYHRQNLLLETGYNDAKAAAYIKDFFKAWQELKTPLEKIINKLKESWNSDRKTKIELSYFG